MRLRNDRTERRCNVKAREERNERRVHDPALMIEIILAHRLDALDGGRQSRAAEETGNRLAVGRNEIAARRFAREQRNIAVDEIGVLTRDDLLELGVPWNGDPQT